MQIHGNDAVRAGGLDAVRAHTRADGNPGLVLLIAFGVGKIGNDDGNGVGACALERVDPEQQLNELIVGRAADGLDDVNILIADGFVDPHKNVALGEFDGFRIAKLCAEIRAHLLGKGPSGTACVDFDNACASIHPDSSFRDCSRGFPTQNRLYQRNPAQASHPKGFGSNIIFSGSATPRGSG